MKPTRLIISIAICLLASAIGSISSYSSIQTWYLTLQKPAFNPPNWVFGPAWITLYLLMGVSLYLVWEKGLRDRKARISVSVFGVQLALNVLWSVLFFGLRSPLYGMVVIVMLWAAIALTILRFMAISKKAGLILVPYIAWVSFAAVLNYYVWILNP